MAIEQCDFYCDLDKVGDLEKQYQQTIRTLTEYYYQLNHVIQTVKTGDSKGPYWKGESFDGFMEEFNEWEESYLRILSILIVIDTYLLTVCDVSSQLISKREELVLYL